MAMTNPYAKYKEAAVSAARPEELVLMCYRGLFQHCSQAVEAIRTKDHAAAHRALVRGQDICTYLRTTLDTGYEIGERLDALYEYMYERLVDANIRKDETAVAEVLGLVEELKDTWAAAVQRAKEGE